MSFNSLKHFFEQHERIISPITLIGGFIFDYLTIKRVDFFWDNFFILIYLVLAGVSIFLLNLHEAGKQRFTKNIHEFLPFTLQFAFGGLFSSFIIFYSKSATLFTSGVFILILLVLFIGNEFFKERYSRLVFQHAVYFSTIFSFAIYFIPVITKKMGAGMFLLSGALSLVLIFTYILFVSRITVDRYKTGAKPLFITIICVYLFINLLYFTNIIPPIPLALKSVDVYHFVEKSGGNYMVIGESDTLGEKFGVPQEIHLKPGEPAYVFASVFAPTDLSINIVHDWQFYYEENNEWEGITRVTFPISGGRDEGYRGYSKKENIYPGKWRVDIKTERGQVIGRVRFNVMPGESTVHEEKI